MAGKYGLVFAGGGGKGAYQMATVKIQQFNRVDYIELDPIAQLVCVTNDFLRLTNANWNEQDLTVLRSALHELGLRSRDAIELGSFFGTLADSPELMERLFQGIDLGVGIVPPDPAYVPVLAGVAKLQALGGEEAYVTHALSYELEQRGVTASLRDLQLSLVRQYLRLQAGLHWEAQLAPFSLAVELLQNLRIVLNACAPARGEVATAEEKAPSEEKALPPGELPAEIRVADLSKLLKVEVDELIPLLRARNRLEREGDLLPAEVAQAVAEEKGVSLAVPTRDPAPRVRSIEEEFHFDFIEVEDPPHQLFVRNVQTAGKTLRPFAISRSLVTKRQFASFLQHVLDNYPKRNGAVVDVEVEDHAFRIQISTWAFHYWKSDGLLSLWLPGLLKVWTGDKDWSGTGRFPLLNLAESGIEVRGTQVWVDPGEEDLPITGVTYYGATAFCYELGRLGLLKCRVPSALHYAAVDVGLRVQTTPALVEWCSEQRLYAGAGLFETPPPKHGNTNWACPTSGFARASFRVVCDLEALREHEGEDKSSKSLASPAHRNRRPQ